MWQLTESIWDNDKKLIFELTDSFFICHFDQKYMSKQDDLLTFFVIGSLVLSGFFSLCIVNSNQGVIKSQIGTSCDTATRAIIKDIYSNDDVNYLVMLTVVDGAGAPSGATTEFSVQVNDKERVLILDQRREKHETIPVWEQCCIDPDGKISTDDCNKSDHRIYSLDQTLITKAESYDGKWWGKFLLVAFGCLPVGMLVCILLIFFIAVAESNRK